MKAVEVVAINNEKMYVPTEDVRMVGPLMDRGLAMLGCAVLYIEGLPPLPIKETRHDIVARLGWEVSNAVVAEDEANADNHNGRSATGQEPGLVVTE